MEFKQYMLREREDLTKIRQIKLVTEDVLNRLEKHYSDSLLILFPTPSKINNHEEFMDWRQDCRKYEQNVPAYRDRKFFIYNAKDNLNAEYFDDKIVLYDQDFFILYTELLNLHHTYEYNLRAQYKSSKNSKIKKEAKDTYIKMMQRFEFKKNDYYNGLFHEITHLFDHEKIGEKTKLIDKNNNAILNRGIKGPLSVPSNRKIYNSIYINSDLETNAWFLTNAQKVWSSEFRSFGELLADFKSHFGYFWALIEPGKQKKMIARLYQLFNDGSRI